MKKTIIGIVAGFIIAAVVIAAGCISTVEPVEETPVVVPEVPVVIIPVEDEQPVEQKEPVQWLRSFPDAKVDSSEEEPETPVEEPEKPVKPTPEPKPEKPTPGEKPEKPTPKPEPKPEPKLEPKQPEKPEPKEPGKPEPKQPGQDVPGIWIKGHFIPF